MVVRRDHLESSQRCCEVCLFQPILLFTIRRPFVPAQTQVERQARTDSPFIGYVKARLVLPEIEVSAVVLVGEVIREAEKHLRKPVSGEWGERLVR